LVPVEDVRLPHQDHGRQFRAGRTQVQRRVPGQSFSSALIPEVLGDPSGDLRDGSCRLAHLGFQRMRRDRNQGFDSGEVAFDQRPGILGPKCVLG
jgi:hypothetical protein